MVYSCLTNELIEGLNIVSKTVALRSTIPALEGICISALDDNTLTLTASNIELGSECLINARVEQPGKAVLPARMLCDIVRKLADEFVSFNIDTNFSAQISSGQTEFKISGMDSSEFPGLPTFDPEHSISVTKKQLKNMIGNTAFCASLDDSKPTLTGCFIELNEKLIHMVAIDGFRLARRTITLDKAIQSQNFIVPAKTLNELNKMLKDSDDNLQINYTSKHASFVFDNCRIISRLIEGTYVNYKQIVPQQSKHVIKCSVTKLLAAVERVSLLITNEMNKSPVKLSIGSNKLNVSCQTGVGQANDVFSIDTGDADMEIGFNNRFLLDALKGCGDSDVNLNLDSESSPLVITPCNGEDFLYLILPVRLK